MSVLQEDILDVVQEHRPGQAELLALWPAARRQASLERILSSDPTTVWADSRTTRSPRRRDRMIRLCVGFALTAVAVVIGASLVKIQSPASKPTSPGGTAPPNAAAQPRKEPVVTAPISFAAKTLPDLARVARTMPANTIKSGQYLHRVVRIHGTGGVFSGSSVPTGDETVLETWMSAEGYLWCKEMTQGVAAPQYFANVADYISLVPANYSKLPTEPIEFEKVLRANLPLAISIRAPQEEADAGLFLMLREMFETGLLPPAVGSAAIQVLSTLPGIKVQPGRKDALGRPALLVTNNYMSTEVRLDGKVLSASHPTQDDLWFDPATSVLLESNGADADDEIIMSADAVDAIPKEDAAGLNAWLTTSKGRQEQKALHFPKIKTK